VALEKLKSILTQDSQANIRIVAKEYAPETLAFLEDYQQVEIIQSELHEGHFRQTHLVFSASRNRALNERVQRIASYLEIPVNCADTPDLCDFYLGSVVKRGDLKIAISTNGKAPILSRRVRELLEQALPEDLDLLLEEIHTIRKNLSGNFETKLKIMEQVLPGAN
jgi:siroheme synthase-like protein